jgi:hypothetical protein
MPIRDQVAAFLKLGPLPSSFDANEVDIDLRNSLLEAIVRPISSDEARALLGCFGPDECFGLAWTLLHTIETASGGVPIDSKPTSRDNEWIQLLWERSHR